MGVTYPEHKPGGHSLNEADTCRKFVVPQLQALSLPTSFLEINKLSCKLLFVRWMRRFYFTHCPRKIVCSGCETILCGKHFFALLLGF
jgi:hypothetical protein